MRKTQKVEGVRLGPTRPSCLPTVRSAKGHPPCLLRMQAQSVLLEALEEHTEYLVGVGLQLEAHHKVVRVTVQKGTPFQARLDLFCEPLVEHRMEVDVAQQWRNNSALRSPFLRVAQLA